MLRAPSSTKREFIKDIDEEISTTGLFSFQQENLFRHPLYLGTLLPGDINENILRPLGYLDYLTTLAIKNGIGLLITNPLKGYKLLTDDQIAAFTEGARATDIPGENATPAERKLFRETLASIASSQAALASNDGKLEQRSVDAGWLLQEAILIIIKPESIAHLLSREETYNYEILVRINEYVQTFTTNHERISAQLDTLVDEIVIATTYTQATKVIAQCEEMLRLNVKHLTRSVTDEDGVVTLTPLDSDYPPKTDTWIIGKLEKHLSEKHHITRLREMVTTAKKGGRTFKHLAKRLRDKMTEYESNKPSLSTIPPPALLRGNFASTSGFEHYPNSLQERSHSQTFDDRTEYSQGVESRWNEVYGNGVDESNEYQYDVPVVSMQPSPVTAFLGRRVSEINMVVTSSVLVQTNINTHFSHSIWLQNYYICMSICCMLYVVCYTCLSGLYVRSTCYKQNNKNK